MNLTSLSLVSLVPDSTSTAQKDKPPVRVWETGKSEHEGQVRRPGAHRRHRQCSYTWAQKVPLTPGH